MSHSIFSEDDKLFFTSDTHFGHENIIRFCNRPFESVAQMNEQLISNWNKAVPEDGIVFHLGDFAFGGSQLWKSVLEQLNGKICLILGNHDAKNLRDGYMKHFTDVLPQTQIQIGNRSVYLNHYPFLCYGGAYNNVWQLFGHVHTSKGKNTGKDFERLTSLFPTQYDVGVDLNDFIPIPWKVLKERIQFQIDNNLTCMHWINAE